MPVFQALPAILNPFSPDFAETWKRVKWGAIGLGLFILFILGFSLGFKVGRK